MQDARAWYPPVEDRIEQLPFLACALTATNQNISPQPVHAMTEGAHLIEVSGHSMLLVVAVDDLPKPCTDLTCAVMLPALKLGPGGFQLRDHPLFRSNLKAWSAPPPGRQ